MSGSSEGTRGGDGQADDVGAARRARSPRLLVASGLSLGLLVFLATIALLLARALLAEPGVPAIQSVTDELQVSRILLVFAHPDDEITATELISRAVREGAHVALVTATRGEAGSQYPELVEQRHLGVVRAAETYLHGWALGISDQTVLDLGDGRLHEHPEEQLTEVVEREILRVRPDLIVSFHPETGLTMHPDHRAIGAAVVQAAPRAARAGDFDEPRIAFVLASRPGLRRFGGPMGREVAELQPSPDFALRADASLKRRGWRIHASQGEFVRASSGIPVWLAYALLPWEYYALSED